MTYVSEFMEKLLAGLKIYMFNTENKRVVCRKKNTEKPSQEIFAMW